MVKKICVLKGSPRKEGNTNSLLKPFTEACREAGAEVVEWNLCEREIRPCLACRACQKDWEQVNCVQQDGMQEIFECILASDLILLATPVYSWYCTPPMKAALDRLVYAMNMYYGETRGPSLWKGKEMALLATCGYPPEKGADLLAEGLRRYCRHSQLVWRGMLCEHHLGYNTVFMNEEKTAHARAFARQLLQEK